VVPLLVPFELQDSCNLIFSATLQGVLPFDTHLLLSLSFY